MRYCIDANLLRFLARSEPGHERIYAHIARVGLNHCFLSAIAGYEIQAAVLNNRLARDERAALSRFLGFFTFAPFGKGAALAAAKLRHELKGKAPAVADLLIAGHAKAMNAAVATHNVKDFERIPGLTVENWLKP